MFLMTVADWKGRLVPRFSNQDDAGASTYDIMIDPDRAECATDIYISFSSATVSPQSSGSSYVKPW